MRTFIASAVAALVLVPAAGAWTKLTGDTLQNIVDPSVVVLPNGSELIAYREPVAGNFKVVHDGATVTVVSGRPIVGDGVILQTGGTLALFFSDDQGAVRSTSSDGGASWSAPVKTQADSVGDVQAGAVEPDGTTLFSQDGTSFLNVFTGGAAGANVFPFCCGYAESLAVDSSGLAQIAFWSNATGQTGYLFGPVGGPYSNLTGGKESLSNDARVPLVVGSTYQLETGARPDGSADVVANTGSNLQSQRLLPGLSVGASGGFARVLDDGFPVAGATLRGGGRTLHTNAAGKARLAGIKRHTAMAVSAAGYTAASFRTP
jgi:hypothetical protein